MLAGTLPRRITLALAGSSLALQLALLPAVATAQDAPRAQRISSGELQRQVQRKPQGVTVPVEISKRGNRLLLQTRDSTIAVSNPDAISANVRQMPVQAVVTQATGNSVRLQGVQLQATKRWNDLPAARRAKYRALDAQQRRVSAAADVALKPNASERDLRQLKQSVEEAEKRVVEAYKSVPAMQRSEQRELVEQHAELRRLNKSLYGLGHDDRYPPQAYQRIYANSRGAFALHARSDDKPRCSAVLIGEKLALTNNHCILEETPDQFEAVFDYEEDLAGNPLAKKTFPVTDIRLIDEDERGNLDFVLLELGANADGALPGAAYPVQCMSQTPVRRDDPLYVIGYPLGDPRTVHDNTFVYFPYRVTPDEYIELKLLVSAEFDSIEAEDASYRDGKLKEFIDSYRLRDGDGDPYYEYVSVRFGDQPTIGVDSDTYHGNSGSPVYNRRTHAVIGLLFDGQEDLSEPWAAGWRSHEAVLPITRILERLDAAAPDWRNDPRVCVRPAI